MKISYAQAEIRTYIGGSVTCGPMRYQLDQEGNKDNNDVFFGFIDPYSNTIQLPVYNNRQLLVHPVINYWSCPESGQEFSSCGC